MNRPTHCSDCGNPFPVLPTNHHGGTGRCIILSTEGDKEICYKCAFERTKKEMATSDRIGAYLSSEGKTVTTWSGETLGTVIDLRYMRLFGHLRKCSIRVRAFDGTIWYARGADQGMHCTLRRAKVAHG